MTTKQIAADLEKTLNNVRLQLEENRIWPELRYLINNIGPAAVAALRTQAGRREVGKE